MGRGVLPGHGEPPKFQSGRIGHIYSVDMSDTKVVTCPNCGQKTRVRAAAEGVPHCPRCGKPLPWLTDSGVSDFNAVAEKSPIPVLIDFWAPWCGPCKIVAPAVEKVSQEMAGQLKAVKVNTDIAPELQERFGVRGIPTLVLMDGGKERDRVVGAMGVDALRQWVGERLPARSK
jgi:thioredoxin 2